MSQLGLPICPRLGPGALGGLQDVHTRSTFTRTHMSSPRLCFLCASTNCLCVSPSTVRTLLSACVCTCHKHVMHVLQAWVLTYHKHVYARVTSMCVRARAHVPGGPWDTHAHALCGGSHVLCAVAHTCSQLRLCTAPLCFAGAGMHTKRHGCGAQWCVCVCVHAARVQ